MRKLFLSVLPFVLFGCSLSGDGFHRAGVTPERKLAQVDRCQFDALDKAGPYGGGFVNVIAYRIREHDEFEICMTKKGYAKGS